MSDLCRLICCALIRLFRSRAALEADGERSRKKRHYVIDHHHLSLALHKEGLRDVLVTAVLDLSALDLDAFWTVLDHKSLVYPFDAQGRRRDFADIPKTVMQLKDDPFRSLAGESDGE